MNQLQKICEYIELVQAIENNTNESWAFAAQPLRDDACEWLPTFSGEAQLILKTNAKGQLIAQWFETCDRCFGAGIYVTPCWTHGGKMSHGTCFKCGGDGRGVKNSLRVITQLRNQKERLTNELAGKGAFTNQQLRAKKAKEAKQAAMAERRAKIQAEQAARKEAFEAKRKAWEEERANANLESGRYEFTGEVIWSRSEEWSWYGQTQMKHSIGIKLPSGAVVFGTDPWGGDAQKGWVVSMRATVQTLDKPGTGKFTRSFNEEIIKESECA